MKFKFSDNNVHFEFEDVCFEVEAAGASVWLQNSLGVIENAQAVLKKAKDNATALNNEDIIGILDEFVKCFDKLLGDGATLQIFGDRPISFFDCYDIYAYITKEIRSFNANKMKGVPDYAEE